MSKVWTLPAGLEIRPLLQMVFLGKRSIRKRLIFVIGGDQITDNGARLPESYVGVGVVDSYLRLACWLNEVMLVLTWNTSVGVHALVRRLLEFMHLEKLADIRNLQFFQDD